MKHIKHFESGEWSVPDNLKGLKKSRTEWINGDLGKNTLEFGEIMKNVPRNGSILDLEVQKFFRNRE